MQQDGKNPKTFYNTIKTLIAKYNRDTSGQSHLHYWTILLKQLKLFKIPNKN